MTTQQPQPSTGDPDITGSVLPDAKIQREAFGFLALSFGVLGSLGALFMLHWAAALSAALIGMCVAGVLVRRHSQRRWEQDAAGLMAFSGYAGQTVLLFLLIPPLGWLAISLLVIGAGLRLAISDEGA